MTESKSITPKKVRHPAQDTNEEFLDRLRDLAMNWRFSDEFIGQLVRRRWAKDDVNE